jgi:hypothetical protein
MLVPIPFRFAAQTSLLASSLLFLPENRGKARNRNTPTISTTTINSIKVSAERQYGVRLWAVQAWGVVMMSPRRFCLDVRDDLHWRKRETGF